jgi:nitronate monooxygenase
MQEIREWFDGPVALSGSIALWPARCWPRRPWGRISAISARAFIATQEANAVEGYKDEYRRRKARRHRLFETCSPAFTAITCASRSCWRVSIPTTCRSRAIISTMNFGSGGNTEAKAWKDIWGSGQGIGAVKEVQSVADMVERLEREYRAAKERLDGIYRKGW